MVMGENVKLIFKRALSHYVLVLQNLKDDEELKFSNDIFRDDIHKNMDNINNMIKGLESPLIQDILDQNRELLCCALQNYIDSLEKMKERIKSKLQTSDPSLPTIKFTKVDEELELARRIQTSSCFEHGYK